MPLSVLAQQILPLYPAEIPNAIVAPDEEVTRDPSDAAIFRLNISRPTLTIYLPKQRDANGAAVIICPGGSYRGLSVLKEGSEVAHAFNAMGVAAFVLKYRTSSDRHMTNKAQAPLQDLQQAIRLVRDRSQQWHVDPQRVGVVGFSAGGHLAATAATQFEPPVLDGHPRALSVRPDFVILAYPVISFTDALAHKVSREMLLGAQPSAESIEQYSNELQVTARTPPTFLVHAGDDTSVPVGNSIRFYEALQAHKVPAELIVYPAGGHGFGLNNRTTTDRWIERCRAWLLSQGWLAHRVESE
ncbi:MAG TPA: alpha/beta hydrolase [Steroidobacteraceae bacterium]|jgi:acetyl esterase/lipase